MTDSCFVARTKATNLLLMATLRTKWTARILTDTEQIIRRIAYWDRETLASLTEKALTAYVRSRELERGSSFARRPIELRPGRRLGKKIARPHSTPRVVWAVEIDPAIAEKLRDCAYWDRETVTDLTEKALARLADQRIRDRKGRAYPDIPD